MRWNEWFFEIAKTASTKSKDQSTKVGCVIVGPDLEVRSIGYNGFVRGADDFREEWHERPMKYKVTAHAELNAVCNAARCGMSLKGCEAFITLPPCAACALALAQSGVNIVNFLVPLTDPNNIEDRWKEDFRIALDILEEARVSSEGFSGKWNEDGHDLNMQEVEEWINRILEVK